MSASDPQPPAERDLAGVDDARDAIQCVLAMGPDAGLSRAQVHERAGAFGYRERRVDGALDALAECGEVYGVPTGEEYRLWRNTEPDEVTGRFVE